MRSEINQFPYVTLSEQVGTPSLPGSGNRRLYVKTDGKLYYVNSSGVEVEIGSAEDAINDLSAHAVQTWAHLPVGTVMEFPSNPDATRFLSLDGHWVDRADWPLLSAMTPSFQPSAPWENGRVTTARNWVRACYSPVLGMWIANTDSANVYARSTDGLAWTEASLPGGDIWNACAWHIDRFIMVGNNGANAYSLDGIAWTVSADMGTAIFGNVHSNGSILVAIPSGRDTATSPDGITWTINTNALPYNISWLSILAGSTFVVLGVSGPSGFIYSSPDGVTWTKLIDQLRIPPLVTPAGALAYDPSSGAMVFAAGGSASQTGTWVSFDNWTTYEHRNSVPATPAALVYVDGVLLASSTISNIVQMSSWMSYDHALSWVQLPLGAVKVFASSPSSVVALPANTTLNVNRSSFDALRIWLPGTSRSGPWSRKYVRAAL